MIASMTRAGQLQASWAARAGRNMAAAAALLTRAPDGQALTEAVEIWGASYSRFAQMQEGFAEQWAAWLHYAGGLKGANSLAKLVERQANISAQAVALSGAQAASVTGWLENLDIDYGFWLSQQLPKPEKTEG